MEQQQVVKVTDSKKDLLDIDTIVGLLIGKWYSS